MFFKLGLNGIPITFIPKLVHWRIAEPHQAGVASKNLKSGKRYLGSECLLHVFNQTPISR